MRLVDAANTHGVDLIDITPIIPFFFNRQLVIDNEFISGQDWPTHPQPVSRSQQRMPCRGCTCRCCWDVSNPLKTPDAWLTPGHADLDVSLHEYLRRIDQTDEIIEVAYNMSPSWGSSSHDVSALMALSAYFFSGMQRQLAAGGKIMGYTARGGNQAIPEAMAAALKNEVRLNQQVIGIRSNIPAAPRCIVRTARSTVRTA